MWESVQTRVWRIYGLDMTVEIASIYMLQWDRKFLEACKRSGIEIILFKRYVDDSVLVLREIEARWIYCKKSKKLIYTGHAYMMT